jgi:organic radical activating enzyme
MLTFQEAKDPDYMAIRARNLIGSLKSRQILTLVVEAASSCNLKCTFCDAHSGRAPKFREHAGLMREETWEKLVADLHVYVAARGPLAMVQFHGNGEPLLNKKLAGMIARIKREGLASKTRVITNGILLDVKKANELIDAGLDEIHISVDTLDRDKYHEVKVGDYAGRVLDNLRAVIPVIEERQKANLYIKYSRPSPTIPTVSPRRTPTRCSTSFRPPPAPRASSISSSSRLSMSARACSTARTVWQRLAKSPSTSSMSCTAARSRPAARTSSTG